MCITGTYVSTRISWLPYQPGNGFTFNHSLKMGALWQWFSTSGSRTPEGWSTIFWEVASRYFVHTVVLHLLCSDEGRWVIVGCWNGSRYKKVWKPLPYGFRLFLQKVLHMVIKDAKLYNFSSGGNTCRHATMVLRWKNAFRSPENRGLQAGERLRCAMRC